MIELFRRLMSFAKRSDRSPLDPGSRVLQQWKDDADRGKDASFMDWTFFDTCCVSDLVKLTDTGNGDRVRQFLRGREIALPITIIQELRRAPAIAARVPEVFAGATLYLIPHPSKFFDCDIWNFLNGKGIERNVLGAFPMDAGRFNFNINLPDLLFSRAEDFAGNGFGAQIKRDRKAGVHERMLVAMAWGKANELMQEQYGIELPPADCRPENFPAIFTYHYAYYFRYLAQRHVVPKTNDFIDLAHAAVAPYCRDFYAEQKLVQMLRRQVKGHAVPTPYQVAKKLFAEEHIDAARHERARRSEDMRNEASPLLLNTNLTTHMEMRQAVLAT